MDKDQTNITIKGIAGDYLNQSDFQGFFSIEGNCACLANDLMTCERPYKDCEAGYKRSCPKGVCPYHMARFESSDDDWNVLECDARKENRAERRAKKGQSSRPKDTR